MSDRPESYGFLDSRYEHFPPVVQIALVSGVCPSACRYCPIGRRNAGELTANEAAEIASPAFFDFDLFREIAKEVAGYPWAILRIHSRGEPLAHPRYDEMIAYAKSCGVQTVTSFTNGILLGRHVAALLDAPIDLLEVSADAASPDLYRRWRRNPHFDEVVASVRLFFAGRNARRPSPTRLVVSAVDHPDFRPHRAEFERFWGPTCDKVLVRPFHTYAGRIPDPYEDQRPSERYAPCVQLWERFSISPAGLVNACYNDWADEEVVGDLRSAGASIAGVWRGAAFEGIRRKSLERPTLNCCFKCSGATVSSWGKAGYQHWVRELLDQPPRL